jgi:starvation-inducible DNA-binding protein
MEKSISIPKALATPHGFGPSATLQIMNALNPLVADAFALWVKTKNFHWHLSGPHFRDLHLLFDEQSDQILAMIDTLAERVRKLGGLTIHSVSEIQSLQTIADDDRTFVSSQDMVTTLQSDNQKFADVIRKAHKVCSDIGDYASTSILEVYIDETERRSWFLYECSVPFKDLH